MNVWSKACRAATVRGAYQGCQSMLCHVLQSCRVGVCAQATGRAAWTCPRLPMHAVPCYFQVSVSFCVGRGHGNKSWSAARRLLDAAGLQNCCCVLWALPSQGDGQSPNLFYMISSCLVHRTIGLMSMAAGEVVAIRGAAHTTEAQSAS